MSISQQDYTQHKATDHELHDILQLILDSFAYMADRIDPPSSILNSSTADLAAQCESGEVWSIATPPVACVCLTPQQDALNIGRLAVAPAHRGQGLGRALIELAEQRAVELGFTSLELMVRVELRENRQLYEYLDFKVKEEAAHPGFDRPTYLVMQKSLEPQLQSSS